ncbi:hypothetical protein Naga_102904g1, partial [Nannochloropsis gaditana]
RRGRNGCPWSVTTIHSGAYMQCCLCCGLWDPEKGTEGGRKGGQKWKVQRRKDVRTWTGCLCTLHVQKSEEDPERRGGIEPGERWSTLRDGRLDCQARLPARRLHDL